LKQLEADKIDLIVYDFDGVMTDNRLSLTEDGVESVVCSRADGLGVDLLRRAGIPQIIISTETNSVVLARARKLGLEALHGVPDKRKALVEYCETRACDLRRVIYVGNDLNDLTAMESVGFPVSPADGHAAIRARSCFVTRAAGGAGVVRELADELLRSGGTHSAIPDVRPQRFAETIRRELDEAGRLRSVMMNDAAVIGTVESMARSMVKSLNSGGRVIFAGNGGSFADAQHLAAEFVGRFMRERAPLAGICLGTNASTVTAVGNDYRFDDVFVRELRAVARKDDVFVALSTSGNSGNLIAAIEAAREIGIHVFALLGKGGGRIATLVPSLVVPSDHTARIQEMHITFGHILCGLVDLMMSDRQPDIA
jgi:D-sedoheptulose 7-phosphate isomerase